MLMVFIFGGVPSSFTAPVTSPAVAGSTVFPAGALAAGAGASDDSSFFPPQPVIARANAPIASEYIPNLVFFTKKFLLWQECIELSKICSTATCSQNSGGLHVEPTWPDMSLITRTNKCLPQSYFPAPPEPPPEGVRPIRDRCSSGVNSNM